MYFYESTRRRENVLFEIQNQSNMFDSICNQLPQRKCRCPHYLNCENRKLTREQPTYTQLGATRMGVFMSADVNQPSLDQPTCAGSQLNCFRTALSRHRCFLLNFEAGIRANTQNTYRTHGCGCKGQDNSRACFEITSCLFISFPERFCYRHQVTA